jgi:misacylated tRNA(Ala) deacylase
MKKTYDPKMHSAEHILNQTMIRMFDCGRCFSAHIERKKSKCDYHFERPLSESEVGEIEQRVNGVIDMDMPVTEEFMSRDEALRSFDMRKVPGDTGDEIRIVRVGDYDACPCIGPHVKSSNEIGRFRVTSTGFEKGVLRIRFKLSHPA